MDNRLIIFGCGGHAKAVLDVILFNKEYGDIIFVDENARKNEKIIDYPVIKHYNVQNEKVFIAVGDNFKREHLCKKYYNNLVSIISNRAYLGYGIKIGKGIFVAHNAYVGIFSSLNDFCVVNTNASIDHECKIGDAVFIGPNSTLCGKVSVGDRTFCGASTVVKNSVSICQNCMIGAGSVILKNITQEGTYVGVPAKKIRKD